MTQTREAQLYMVAACIAFGLLWVLIRISSETMHPILIVFYRTLFGFLSLTPFYLKEGRNAFKTEQLNYHLIRGCAALVATFCIFYAITVVPLAKVVAITYVAPVFAAFVAIYVLKEKVHIRRIISMAVGFVGVLVVLRPEKLELNTGEILAFFGAIGIAVTIIMIKVLSKTDRSKTIVAYSYAIVLPVSFVTSLFFWQWPTWSELGILAFIGVSVTIAQLFTVKAFSKADLTAILPLDFIRLILATLFGYFLFGEPIDQAVWVGALIILASTIYIAHREAHVKKQEDTV